MKKIVILCCGLILLGGVAYFLSVLPKAQLKTNCVSASNEVSAAVSVFRKQTGDLPESWEDLRAGGYLGELLIKKWGLVGAVNLEPSSDELIFRAYYGKQSLIAVDRKGTVVEIVDGSVKTLFLVED